MSDELKNIRIALESKLNSITPAISTAWENVAFTPVAGTAYQACYTLRAEPDNATIGDGYFRERGIFQVNLFYPAGAGPAIAEARAALIRSAYARGTTLISGGIKVIIERTPEVGAGRADGDRWMIPVKIRWFAGVFS